MAVALAARRRAGGPRRPRRAGGGVRGARPRSRRRAGGAAVHERDGRRELPPGRRRGRTVGRADAGRHGRPPTRAARCRRAADDRPERACSAGRCGGSTIPAFPTRAAASSWRSLARRALEASASGPVHLNLPFREPLVGTAGELPTAVPIGCAAARRAAAASACGCTPTASPTRSSRQRGVILAGGRSGVRPDEVAALARGHRVAGARRSAVGLPRARRCGHGVRRVAPARRVRRAITGRRSSSASAVRPASKVLGTWVASSGAHADPGRRSGSHRPRPPRRRVAASVGGGGARRAAPTRSSARVTGPRRGRRRRSAPSARSRSSSATSTCCPSPAWLASSPSRVPDGGRLVVASSMPVRDLEWFGGAGRGRPRQPRRQRHRRRRVDRARAGAARPPDGRARRRHRVPARRRRAHRARRTRRADLRIVVVDNDGGGIFSFLPQATALAGERFEQLFGTPHGTDVVAVARAHGLDADTVTTAEALRERLGRAAARRCTRVPTDRAANVAIHAAINAAVADAVWTDALTVAATMRRQEVVEAFEALAHALGHAGHRPSRRAPRRSRSAP